MAQRIIEIAEIIRVGELAEKLEVPVTSLITQLMKNGIMATVNEQIDFDSALLVLAEFMPEVELKKIDTSEETPVVHIKHTSSSKAVVRPPVVAVMGHVDHGKTSLLDAIRGSKVVEGESGGITQHISAYQVEHKGQKLTFLDTPGHEAFAALRQHGASLTDIVVIVVAADDGVKPQTKEAIRFAKQAGAKIVVAINKIDKTGADANRVRQELATEKVMIEEWGGEVIAVEVSAKTNVGIDKLLDTILLVAEVEELKADIDCPGEGIVIEAHMEQGRGPVATVLVEHGMLRPKMSVVAGGALAKVRTLQTTAGETIKEAGPSTPVIITGFKSMPQFSDQFKVYKDEKTARLASEEYLLEHQDRLASNLNITSTEVLRRLDKQRDQVEIPVILRADVQGSLTSISQGLQSLEHAEVKVVVIATGVGNVTESDISLAEASKAIIYGFSVQLSPNIKQLANRRKVPVRVYKVIYELLDDVKSEMTAKLEPEITEDNIGRLILKGLFRTTPTQVICGGEVTKGKVIPGALVRAFRDEEPLGEGIITNLRRQDKPIKQVVKGETCGLELQTTQKLHLKLEDKLEIFWIEKKQRTL